MNYGYAPIDESTEMVDLNPADLDDRSCIQLYHHVVNGIDLRNLNVVEVGSGRGGGASYIKRYLQPKTMVGIDLSANAVQFCQRNYAVDGLSFKTGNAEDLPLEDNSADAIINVESSHCYVSMESFLNQIKRVLGRGGYFLFADFRGIPEMDLLRKELHASGLTLLQETDITPNILKALDLDNDHKIALIQQWIHGPLVKTFLEFAAIKGSTVYELFQNGELLYHSFILQKQTD